MHTIVSALTWKPQKSPFVRHSMARACGRTQVRMVRCIHHNDSRGKCFYLGDTFISQAPGKDCILFISFNRQTTSMVLELGKLTVIRLEELPNTAQPCWSQDLTLGGVVTAWAHNLAQAIDIKYKQTKRFDANHTTHIYMHTTERRLPVQHKLAAYLPQIKAYTYIVYWSSSTG